MTEDVKKTKKLAKEIEGTIISITVQGGTKGTMLFDFSDLPADIQTKLGPFGLGHKLGDAAAGKEGADAEDSINKVYDGLVGGDWSVRAPAQPKISLSALAANFKNLSPEEKEAALPILKALNIPGLDALL